MPILMTLLPEAPEPEPPSEPPELPPQAARDKTMASVSSRANSFFILFILLELAEWISIPRLWNILCGFQRFCKMNNTQKERDRFSAFSLKCPHLTGFMSV